MGDPNEREVVEARSGGDGGSARYIYLVSVVAAVGGFLFGYDTAVISGAMLFLKTRFQLAAGQEGFATSVLLIGCAVGASLAGTLSDRLGRRRILIAAAILFAASAVFAAIPRTMTEFLVARFLGGLAVGIASMLSPLYIAEIAPANIRGRLVTLNQMAIVVGMLSAYFVDWLLADIGPTNWRWMFASAALPSVMFLFALSFVPESPRWLTKQGHSERALAILTRVGGRRHAEVEMEEIRETIAQESASIGQLLQPGLRTALVIGVMLAIFQQITGINTILYYAPRIFLNAGYPGESSAILASVIVGATNFLCTGVALAIIDRLGRKPLLLIGSAGMGLSFLLLGLAFRSAQPSGAWILVLILSYVGFFAIGLGPVVWVLMSEIFPTRIRGRAMAIATVSLWIACFVVSVTFPSLVEGIGEGNTFWIYAAICAITFVFVWVVISETKGKTLEEIERSWRP